MDERQGTTTFALTPEQLAGVNRLATAARFVSALAHDLNNSLQIMSGLAELLAERDDLPADVLLRLGRIGAQADLASDKIKQVVSYVREPVRAGERLDLAAIVDRALTLRSFELGRSGITVRWARPLDAYPVVGHVRDLQQAVLNLLANAQDALAAAETRELRITLTSAAGLVRLTMADTGAGVPAELRARIFDPFFTTRASTGALGLGLPVAAHTATVHGGRLTLAEEGQGATFVLELPADSATSSGD